MYIPPVALMPFLLCVVCVVGLIWINTISNPPAYKYEMDFNYWVIFIALLSGWVTWSLST